MFCRNTNNSNVTTSAMTTTERVSCNNTDRDLLYGMICLGPTALAVVLFFFVTMAKIICVNVNDSKKSILNQNWESI